MHFVTSENHHTVLYSTVLYCIVHYTLYTEHYTLYTEHYTLYTEHYTQYTEHCTLHTEHYTLYHVHYSALNHNLVQCSAVEYCKE